MRGHWRRTGRGAPQWTLFHEQHCGQRRDQENIRRDKYEPEHGRHIDAGGTVSWNGSPTPLSTLQAQFDVESARAEGDVGKQPTIEIETDPDAEYDTLAKVLSRAKNADLVKISFVNPSAQ